MKKKIFLLGATGSIGTSTLDVIRTHPESFELVAVTAHRNYEKLLGIAEEFDISTLAFSNGALRNSVKYNHNIYFGEDEICKLIAELDYDILLNAVVGSAGLQYTIAALENHHHVALANKESLVMAGEIIMPLAKKNKCALLPVDSEHSAIFQCLMGVNDPATEVRKLILTASGGPFRNRPLETFSEITREDTLQHTTWSMGAKITVDSATMANKGLEVIEAHHLFNVDFDSIEVTVHPQSIVHSMIELNDGSLIAQMSYPDMKIPIQLALSYPQRIKASAKFSSPSTFPALTFEEPDMKKFPLLALAYEVGKTGGIYPTIFNAANEAAVMLFLKNRIHFTHIHTIVTTALDEANALPLTIAHIHEMNDIVKKNIYDKWA